MFDIFAESFKKKPALDIPVVKKRKSSNKSSLSETEKSSSLFKKGLKETLSKEKFNSEVDLFLKDLDILQSKLVENPSVETIEEYRESIGQFLDHSLSNYQAIPYFRGMKNRVELKVWHLVNQNMDSLAQQVIKDQVKGIALLSKLHMVKGLILDLKVGK